MRASGEETEARSRQGQCGVGRSLRRQKAHSALLGLRVAELLPWRVSIRVGPQSLEATGQIAYPPFSLSPEDAAVKGRLVECLETVLNKAQEPPKSKKVQHSNAKNAILFETISLIIHYDRCCGQGCGQLGPLPWGRTENSVCPRKEGWCLTPESEG